MSTACYAHILLLEIRMMHTSVVLYFITAMLFFLQTAPVAAAPLDQLMPLTSGQKKVQQAEYTTSDSDINRARSLRQSAKMEFDRVNAPGGFDAGAPPATPQHELTRRRLLLRIIAANYDRLVDELNRQTSLTKTLNRAGRLTNAKSGAPGKTSVSILQADQIRSHLQLTQLKLKQTRIALESYRSKIFRAEDSLQETEKKLHNLLEQIENESVPEKRRTLEWSRYLAELREKLDSSELQLHQVVLKNLQLEEQYAKNEQDRLVHDLARIMRTARFSGADLAIIRTELEKRHIQYEKGLDQALSEHAALQTRHHDLANGMSTAVRSEMARQQVEERLINSNLRVELCRDRIELNRFELLIWELRYSAETDKNVSSASRITQLLPVTLARLDKEEEEALLALQQVFNRLNTIDSVTTAAAADLHAMDQASLVPVYRAREAILLEQIKHLSAIRIFLTVLHEQYSEKTGRAGAAARLDSAKSKLHETVTAIWRYEVFTAEDIYTVDGTEIKGRRGVTVGKIISAVALAIFGWLISSKITRIAVNEAVKRRNVQEGSALLVRRWVMALILCILLFSSLYLVHIPLTAFAFLGGAIALGTGFGIQVLMKNLMSGLMLLSERPFRIGDLIDVDGVRGRVTSIGIRSCTVRDVAGIETLIPNSTFVEKNITNWTYSTHQVRYSLSVGVAYGSSVQEVKKLLLTVAELSVDVLKEPEPLATLDDFGADALVFGLHYWIRLDSMVDPRLISSNLRVEIEKILHDHGIAIAFPQRDIHLDTAGPLKVELINNVPPAF